MLKGKVAVVTGGTRGIGYETVRKFLNNGAKVALFGSKEETVKEAIKKLKEENNLYEVVGFYPNLVNEVELEQVFDKIINQFGKIDILVNNAGISSKTKLEDYTLEEYDKITTLNIKAVFMCSKVIVPYLKQTKGVILNTSSIVSIYGQSSGVMYPASKFAVNGITKSLAKELAKDGIRVNAVAPGIIETDMVRNLPRKVIDPLIEKIPLGRIGKPDDVANAFLFLASDMASYISGVILSVDGLAQN
jgi:3-oxoacyl-[acyl-carrier protein] reductase/7-alpha-hydroxysteroid dehydrogenase